MTSDLEGEEPDAGCRSPAPGDGVAQLIAGSGAVLLLRRIAIQAISAGSTAVLARTLSVKGFGAYSAGLAMYYVALSICDFGFGAVLGRELGQGSATDGSIVRGMLRIQTIWSGVVALGAVAFALFVGLGASKMQVLLVLSPAVALFGLNCVKQVFYASYKVGVLSRIDISTNVLQAIAVSLVALLGGSPAEVAAALSAVIALNAIVISVVGLRMLDAARPTPMIRRRLLRASLPLGLSSLLASAYFTIDLSIIAFLVNEHQVGYYSAATKVLTLLAVVPGLIVTAGLPGLSAQAKSPRALGALAARLWHWIVVACVPASIGAFLFAPILVRVYFGSRYLPAVPLVRIMSIAGILVCLSNVFGAAMVVTARARWLIVQGIVGLSVNVIGNLLLVPRFGVRASAWLTVGTEFLVCGGSVIGLLGTFRFKEMARVTAVPALGALAMVGTWWLTRHWVVVSMVLSTLAFAAVLQFAGGWPDEVTAMVRSRRNRGTS